MIIDGEEIQIAPEPTEKELAIIRCRDAISNNARIFSITARNDLCCRDIPYVMTPEQSRPVFQAMLKALTDAV